MRTILLPYTRTKIGGSHISGVSLASGLRSRFGVRCVVAAPPGAQVLSFASQTGIETLELRDAPAGRWRPHYDLARTPSRMAILARLGKGTIVHCNDLSSLQAWLLAAKLTRTPIVFHARGLDRRFWPYDMLRRAADHVVAISACCDANMGFIPADRRSILINPFMTPVDYDAAGQRANILRELGAPPDSRLVGFVGNFWRRKRPDFFIEVAARLAAEDPSAYFVLFGRDSEMTTDQLRRQLSEIGLATRTLLAGFRLPPEANIAALDLLLAPALREPFGRTLVEALLMGVPYVATDDAGHSEIHARWGGGALLPEAADAQTYSRACAEVLNDRASTALSLARRREIAAILSPERHAEDVMAVYENL